MTPAALLSTGTPLRTLRLTTTSSPKEPEDAPGRGARRRTPSKAALLAQLFGEHATPERLRGSLLTTSDVATLFDISQRTVTEWARRGRLPALRTPGGHHRFPALAVRDLLVATRHVPRALEGQPADEELRDRT